MSAVETLFAIICAGLLVGIAWAWLEAFYPPSHE